MNTNDEIKHLQNLNNALAVKVDQGIQKIERLTDKLHAYEKQWTDMNTTIAHLRQENAELKAKNLEMREVLSDCSLHFEEMEDVVWNDDSDINSTTFQRVQESVQKALTPPNPQHTQDPATRKERCKLCGNMVSDWVDPDWAHGRICRECENKHDPERTQDTATAIAYGLYPSSARPVNPK